MPCLDDIQFLGNLFHACRLSYGCDGQTLMQFNIKSLHLSFDPYDYEINKHCAVVLTVRNHTLTQTNTILPQARTRIIHTHTHTHVNPLVDTHKSG